MRALRGVLVIAAVVAVLGAWFNSRSGDEPRSTANVVTAPAGAVRLTFVYSSNLEEMLAPLLVRFNGERHDLGSGPIFVEGVPKSSGEAHMEIVAGRLQPHAWSPASTLWGELLNHQLDRSVTADENPSLVRSPVVVAMWEPLARALGWPTKPIGFSDILELATTKSDWTDYGKPAFGTFKLGHTNPDFSTSGLSFVAAQYYTAAGKREGLTIEDVRRPENRAKVRSIQQSIVHYGNTGSFFEEQLAIHGPLYASAVAMEEITMLEFNEKRKADELKLAAIYPAEGTYVADNPFMVLDAPWVGQAERAAAEELGRWLLAELTPELVARFNYRPGDPDVAPGDPVSRENGALPGEPRRQLSLPEPRVLAEIKRAWHEDRKPANVLLVVDVSGSMTEEDRIGKARRGLQTFLRELSPRDHVGLATFSNELRSLVPIAPFAENESELRRQVSELFADGETALFDATIAGWETVDGLADDTRINAVVVLSDGDDTSSERYGTIEEVEAKLRIRGIEGRQIRIFTIAYGSKANERVLAKIAEASGGKAFSGDPQTIGLVYLQISSYF